MTFEPDLSYKPEIDVVTAMRSNSILRGDSK